MEKVPQEVRDAIDGILDYMSESNFETDHPYTKDIDVIGRWLDNH